MASVMLCWGFKTHLVKETRHQSSSQNHQNCQRLNSLSVVLHHVASSDVNCEDRCHVTLIIEQLGCLLKILL